MKINFPFFPLTDPNTFSLIFIFIVFFGLILQKHAKLVIKSDSIWQKTGSKNVDRSLLNFYVYSAFKTFAMEKIQF